MQSIIESLLASEHWLQAIRFFLGSSLLLGGALLVDRLHLLRRLSLLSCLWHGALAGSLLLLVPLTNPLGVTLFFRTSSSALDPVSPANAEMATSDVTLAVAPLVTSVDSQQLVWLFWALGSAILLARLLVLARRETVALGNRIAVDPESPLFKEFARLSQRLGLRKTPRLSFSDTLVSAVTLPFGEICLPAALVQRDPVTIRGVLAHELSHIKQHDVPRLMALQVLACVFFFQPLLRVARDRLADIAEFQADRRAVEQCHAPEELARALLTCADGFADKQRSTVCYPMHGNPSRLRARIEQIMGRGQLVTKPSGLLPRVMLTLAIIAATAFLPGFFRGPVLLADEIGRHDALHSCDSYQYELVVDAVHKGRISGEHGLALWEQHCGTESGDIVDQLGKQYGLPGHHLWYMAKVKPMSNPYLSEVFRHGNTLEILLYQNRLNQLTLPSDAPAK